MKQINLEPQLFELTNSISNTRTDLVYEITPQAAIIKPTDYTHSIFIEKADTSVIGFDSGYVRENDVNFVSIVKEQLTLLPIESVSVGDFVWILREDPDWNVYRNVAVENSVINIIPLLPDDREIDFEPTDPNTGFTVYFENNVTDFVADDIIGIRSNYTGINGFFKVKEVFLNQVVILTATTISEEEYNDSSVGGISKFVKRRFVNANDLNLNIQNIIENLDDKVWIDNKGDGNFGIYSNEKIFTLQEETLNPTGDGDGFASSFDVNKFNTTMVVNSIDNFLFGRDESVRVLKRNSESFTKDLSQVLIPDNTIDKDSLFGFDVAISADSVYIAVGTPNASNALQNLLAN